MSTFIRNAAILGGLLLATASFAQVKATATDKATAQPMSKDAQERQKMQDAVPIVLSADYMTQELGLSNDQSEKLKSVEEGMNKQMMDMEKLDPKERAAKQDNLMIEHNKIIASVLNPEQNKKMAEIKADMRKQNTKTNEPIK